MPDPTTNWWNGGADESIVRESWRSVDIRPAIAKVSE
jgi:hypothetical protein